MSKPNNPPFNSKEFKNLQSKWYKRLKDSGFVDIETPQGDLKTSHVDYFKYRQKKHGVVYFEAREEYFRLAREFLQKYKFESTREKTIWSLHSEGISIRDIVKHLNKQGYKTYRRAVHETVQRLANEMKIKTNG